MLPNLLSSTMNLADLLGKNEQKDNNNNQNKTGEQNNPAKKTAEKKEAGRPEKANDEKSEKTI